MFKAIKGYENRYLISSEGKVLSLLHKTPKELIPCQNSQGYIESVLVDGLGKRRNEKWHRLVAKAFIPNPNNLPQINHKNGKKTDNRVENLEWCNHSTNVRHAIDILGRKMGGTKGVFPKWLKKRLNDEQVATIKMRLGSGEKGLHVAKDYGVSDQTIYDIKNGRCWKEQTY